MGNSPSIREQLASSVPRREASKACTPPSILFCQASSPLSNLDLFNIDNVGSAIVQTSTASLGGRWSLFGKTVTVRSQSLERSSPLGRSPPLGLSSHLGMSPLPLPSARVAAFSDGICSGIHADDEGGCTNVSTRPSE